MAREQRHPPSAACLSASMRDLGYSLETAIADIAKRLGIGHGTFYRHFANKRDILEHVIDDVTKKITADTVVMERTKL